MLRNTNNTNRRRRRLFFFAFLAVLFFVLSAVVMQLWNNILPAVLHVNTVTYWQAAGLLLLCRILFRGFKPGGYPHRFGGPPPHLKDKWMHMSDEEKIKFREEWKKRCEQRKQ